MKRCKIIFYGYLLKLIFKAKFSAKAGLVHEI
jgi:hypothetical protein